MVFPQKKGIEPSDQSNKSKNYMKQPPRIWSQSPADLERAPAKGMPGLNSNQLVNNSQSIVLHPARKARPDSAPSF